MDEPLALAAARAWMCTVVQRRVAAHRQHGRGVLVRGLRCGVDGHGGPRWGGAGTVVVVHVGRGVGGIVVGRGHDLMGVAKCCPPT